MSDTTSKRAASSSILVTGAAGFIGSHLCERLLARGHRVIGVDNFDPFYDPAVKHRNLEGFREHDRFCFLEADIRDREGLEAALEEEAGDVDVIVHLAARAGVRPSIEDPEAYTSINVDGTVALLELARRRGISRFVFGSSSSVYGNNPKVPFSEDDPVEEPISPYAATKRAGELLCHTWHHLYGLSIVSLRFFTVYGPRQRPDLAIHKFARLMAEGRPIPMYGDGSTRRDYTYIDDILQGIEGAIDHTDRPEPVWEIVNLGESHTTTLSRLIELVSGAMGVEPRSSGTAPAGGRDADLCGRLEGRAALRLPADDEAGGGDPEVRGVVQRGAGLGVRGPGSGIRGRLFGAIVPGGRGGGADRSRLPPPKAPTAGGLSCPHLAIAAATLSQLSRLIRLLAHLSQWRPDSRAVSV
jgi:UDP-glucuronate 4-epimerase